MASPCACCSKEAAMATRTADARGAGLPWPRPHHFLQTWPVIAATAAPPFLRCGHGRCLCDYTSSFMRICLCYHRSMFLLHL
jgi:hypothetical protein